MFISVLTTIYILRFFTRHVLVWLLLWFNNCMYFEIVDVASVIEITVLVRSEHRGTVSHIRKLQSSEEAAWGIKPQRWYYEITSSRTIQCARLCKLAESISVWITGTIAVRPTLYSAQFSCWYDTLFFSMHMSPDVIRYIELCLSWSCT